MGEAKNIPVILPENVKMLFDGRFLRLSDMEIKQGVHYFNATRRTKEDLAALKSDDEFQSMPADAVSCVVIIKQEEEDPKLLLSYEYRYPAGRFLLSVPAGLIDEEDRFESSPVIAAAVREIKEETGLDVKPGDVVSIINPFLFSSPGMTDEGNALACAVIHVDDLSNLSQSGAVGTEVFDGFELLDKEEARIVLQNGRDKHGNFYSIQTWAALMYFISDMWKTGGSD